MKTIPDSCLPIDQHRPLYLELKETKGYHGIERCLRCEKDTAEERMLDMFFCTECGFAWQFDMFLALRNAKQIDEMTGDQDK